MKGWAIDDPRLDTLPAQLSDALLRDILGLQRTQFSIRKTRGDFDFLRMYPALPGSLTPWSGVKVRQYQRGEMAPVVASPVAVEPEAPRTRAYLTGARRLRVAR